MGWAAQNSASPGSGLSRGIRRAVATAEILKSKPDESAIHAVYDAKESVKFLENTDTGNPVRATTELGSLPVADLDMLGGITYKSTSYGGRATCNMQTRVITMYSNAQPGDSRHEAGHAIHGMLMASPDLKAHVEADYNRAIAASKKLPAGLSTKLSTEWYQENYGIIGSRALDSVYEHAAEAYRGYHRAMYRDRHEGGAGNEIAKYRARLPAMASLFDSYYTAVKMFK